MCYFHQGGRRPRILSPPEMMMWRHETGRESQHKNDAHLLLYVAQNSTEDLKMVKEHKEELITKSIEAFRFTSERQEKVKCEFEPPNPKGSQIYLLLHLWATSGDWILPPPEIMMWRHKAGWDTHHLDEMHVIIFIVDNRHREGSYRMELISKSRKPIRFAPAMREKANWYRPGRDAPATRYTRQLGHQEDDANRVYWITKQTHVQGRKIKEETNPVNIPHSARGVGILEVEERGIELERSSIHMVEDTWSARTSRQAINTISNNEKSINTPQLQLDSLSLNGEDRDRHLGVDPGRDVELTKAPIVFVENDSYIL
ncbi:hypothetical protein GG344DRAFT_70659 [Lentinula edodes]|nr:hypothetical protein GG344DRAFT_70659 [Lentinula edodes]